MADTPHKHQASFTGHLGGTAEIEHDFAQWLEDDRREMVASWQALRHAPDDVEALMRFEQSIYTINANAPLLGCPTVGSLAKLFLCLLGSPHQPAAHIALFDAVVQTMSSMIANQASLSDQVSQSVLREMSDRLIRLATQV